MEYGMKGIMIGENPLTVPPIEIVKQGNEAVINYFEQREAQGTVKIFEAKLMLVGEPGAGKTSLQHKLFDKNYPVPDKRQKSTTGIQIRQNWNFDYNDVEYKTNVWDFGG